MGSRGDAEGAEAKVSGKVIAEWRVMQRGSGIGITRGRGERGGEGERKSDRRMAIEAAGE